MLLQSVLKVELVTLPGAIMNMVSTVIGQDSVTLGVK